MQKCLVAVGTPIPLRKNALFQAQVTPPVTFGELAENPFDQLPSEPENALIRKVGMNGWWVSVTVFVCLWTLRALLVCRADVGFATPWTSSTT